MDKPKIDFTYKNKDCQYSYESHSMACDFGEVHKGIVFKKGGCVDFCIPYEQALTEIKALRKEKQQQE